MLPSKTKKSEASLPCIPWCVALSRKKKSGYPFRAKHCASQEKDSNFEQNIKSQYLFLDVAQVVR